MVVLKLFWEFFVIGLCAFGGGLATIPFLGELGLKTGWFTADQLKMMIAVAESTPGAIGINMSTYVGYTVGMQEFSGNQLMGFLCSIVSTLGLVSPSIICIIIIAKFLTKFKDNKYVKWVFYGLRAASIGLISSVAFSLLNGTIVDFNSASEAFAGFEWANFFKDIWLVISNYVILLFGNFKGIAVALFLGILIFKYKKHPILYIAIAALLGIILQM